MRGRLAADVEGARPVTAEMPPLHQQVHGRHHPGIGRPDDRGIVADADKLRRAGRQQCLHLCDEAEFTQIRDGDVSPLQVGCRCPPLRLPGDRAVARKIPLRERRAST